MNRRSTKLFFLELVFVLFSFSICALVCVKIFTNAHLISVKSKETSAAIVKAQSAAESFKAGDWEELGLQGEPQKSLVLYYDQNWKTSSTPDRRALTMAFQTQGTLLYAQITVSLDGTALFSLVVCRTSGGVML